MGEILLTAREAVTRVAALSTYNINIREAAARATPDHAHWLEQPLPDGELFQTAPQFRRWAQTYGLPHAIKAAALSIPKVEQGIVTLSKTFGQVPDFLNPNSTISSLYKAYFKYHGIEADVIEARFGYFDPKAGAFVSSDTDLPHWNPDSTASLFPEVDYQVTFQLPNASADLNADLRDYTGINLNTSKIKGTLHSFHGVGVPYGKNYQKSTIASGEYYLKRLDQHLKKLGLEQGIDEVKTDLRSVRQIEALEAAAIKKFPQSNRLDTAT